MAADANKAALAYLEESTYNTTPASPTLTYLRLTGESISFENESIQSAEIRSDRQVTDVIRVGRSTAGDTNHELSYAEYDPLLEAGLLSSDWAAAVVVASDDTGVTVTDTDTFTHGSGWDNTPAVGQWIKVSGYTSPENNGVFKVTASSSTTVTVTPATLSAEAAGDTINIVQGARIQNGTELRFFTLEKQINDASGTTDEFEKFTGQVINTVALDTTAKQIATLTFGWLGANMTPGSATIETGTTTASSTNDVFNAVDNVTKVIEGGAESSSLLGITMNLNNNLRAREVIGTLGAVSMGTGTCNITGTVRAYYESEALVTKSSDWSASSLALVMTDADGNILVFDMPRIKYTSAPHVISGQDEDIIAEMNYQAYMDPTELITVRIVRFPAA